MPLDDPGVPESIDRFGQSADGTSTVVLRSDDFKSRPHPEKAAMGSDLFVGRIGLESLEASLASHIAGLGLKLDLQQLFEGEEDAATLCFLNEASIVAFLEHVEGCPNGNTALRAAAQGAR